MEKETLLKKIDGMELQTIGQIGPGEHDGSGVESNYFREGYNAAIEDVKDVIQAL
jgi:hypothetical protein